MAGKRHGMAWIKVDGGLLATMPGATLDMGGKVRASVVGDNAVLGYSEQIRPSKLECEVSLGQGTSAAAFQAIADQTITYEADTGQTYVVRSAFLTEPPTISSGEGKVKLVFEGQPAEEMGA